MQTVGIPAPRKEPEKDWHLIGYREGFNTGRVCGLREAAEFIFTPECSYGRSVLLLAANFLKARANRLEKGSNDT